MAYTRMVSLWAGMYRGVGVNPVARSLANRRQIEGFESAKKVFLRTSGETTG
jgi:hypothetical protein